MNNPPSPEVQELVARQVQQLNDYLQEHIAREIQDENHRNFLDIVKVFYSIIQHLQVISSTCLPMFTENPEIEPGVLDNDIQGINSQIDLFKNKSLAFLRRNPADTIDPRQLEFMNGVQDILGDQIINSIQSELSRLIDQGRTAELRQFGQKIVEITERLNLKFFEFRDNVIPLGNNEN